MTTPCDDVQAAAWEDVRPVALPEGARASAGGFLLLEPEPRNVSLARQFVAEQAEDLDDDTRDTLALLTSELVTNAVVHARTEVRVSVVVTETDVLVAVHDLDLGRREADGPERDGGRGLTMVEALAAATGSLQHRGGGKTCWFRLSRSGGAA